MTNSLIALIFLLKCRIFFFFAKIWSCGTFAKIYQKTYLFFLNACLFNGEWEQVYICSLLGFMKIKQKLEVVFLREARMLSGLWRRAVTRTAPICGPQRYFGQG
jgi:hypothetical protein